MRVAVEAFAYSCDGCGADYEWGDFTIFTDDEPWMDDTGWLAEGGMHICADCYCTLSLLCEEVVDRALPQEATP